MCAAVRSCASSNAAVGPWPITSPTTSPVRIPGSATMSHQSPPTTWPGAGVERQATSTRSGNGGGAGPGPPQRRAAGPVPGELGGVRDAGAGPPGQVGDGRDLGVGVRPAAAPRDVTSTPVTSPSAVSGTARNEEWWERSSRPAGRTRFIVTVSGRPKSCGVPLVRPSP